MTLHTLHHTNVEVQEHRKVAFSKVRLAVQGPSDGELEPPAPAAMAAARLLISLQALMERQGSGEVSARGGRWLGSRATTSLCPWS